MDGYCGVEAGVESIAGNIELASQLKIDVDRAAVCFVRSFAVSLVVVHLGYRRTPVYDEPSVVIVGKTRIAYVEFFRGGAWFVLEHHFGEIGLGLQNTYRGKLFRVGALSAIVRIDDAIHVCVFDIGFLFLAVACEI